MKNLLVFLALVGAACSVRLFIDGEADELTEPQFIARLRQEAGQQNYILIFETPRSAGNGQEFTEVVGGTVRVIYGRHITVADLDDVGFAHELIRLSRGTGFQFHRYSGGAIEITPPSTTTPPPPPPPTTPYIPITPEVPTLPPQTGILCDNWRPSRPGRTYRFGYAVNHPPTGDIKCHKESRDGDWAEGIYQLVEPDGNLRTVTYTSDKDVGFIADVVRTYDVADPAPSRDHPWRMIVKPGYAFSRTIQREDGRW